MNDKLIFSDGNTLWITLESKVRNWVKILLIVINICLYCVPILLLASSWAKEGPKLIFAAMAMSGMFFYVVTRSTLWNIFGRESIVITSSQFSFYRDFGLYRTPLKTIDLNYGLSAYTQNELTYMDEPYVVITFCELLPNEENRVILTTGIKTPEKNYILIQEHLDEIFASTD